MRPSIRRRRLSRLRRRLKNRPGARGNQYGSARADRDHGPGSGERGSRGDQHHRPEPTATRTYTDPPTIQSDKDDYPPGGRVTLTGANWQPGEVVHIYVNDDHGSSWSRNVDVIADETGQITDAFNLPDWFVAEYSVVATGSESGTSRTTFTDGTITSVTVQIRESTCTTGQSSFATGQAVCARASVTIINSGNTNWAFRWFAPGVPTSGTPARITVVNSGNGTTSDTKTDVFTPSGAGSAGTWTVLVCESSGAGACQGTLTGTATFAVAAAPTNTPTNTPNTNTPRPRILLPTPRRTRRPPPIPHQYADQHADKYGDRHQHTHQYPNAHSHECAAGRRRRRSVQRQRGLGDRPRWFWLIGSRLGTASELCLEYDRLPNARSTMHRSRCRV